MDVDDTIEEFIALLGKTFGRPRMFNSQWPIFWTRDKYDHRTLEQGVKDIVLRHSISHNEAGEHLFRSDPDLCKR